MTGWDSHNRLVLALDRDQCVHLAGNLHADPLVYYRTRQPLDLKSLERLDRMTGDRENQCTYPVFFHTKDGALRFRYRDGISGNGSDIYNAYDEDTRTWRHVLSTPLHDGEGQRNAYALDPRLGPDGRFHVLWMWRDTPDAATNHDLCYARSADLVQWEDAHGRAIALPITQGRGDLVDGAQPGAGLVNTTFALGFAEDGTPIVFYHRYDAAGHSQLFAAKPAKEGWQRRALTNWDFRWAFGGFGTLDVEVGLGVPQRTADGNLLVPFSTRAGGAARLEVDPARLVVLAQLPPEPPPLPAALMQAQGKTPGLIVHAREARDVGKRYVLRWETWPSNRDQPRESAPPASELRLYVFDEPGKLSR